MSVFSIDGYFKDDKSEFSGFLISEFSNTPKGYSDEDIFFYGLGESELRDAVEQGEDTTHEFVVTSFEKVEA